MEGHYSKAFDQYNPYPRFSQSQQNPDLTFYGLGETGGLFTDFLTDEQEGDKTQFNNINDQDIKLKIQKQEDERNKAIEVTKKEQAQIQAYNRFTELQTEYGQQFTYQYNSFELRTKNAAQSSRSPKTIEMNCRVLYLPFEGRLDKDSYELFLRNTMPKELLMIGDTTRINTVKEFVQSNFLPIRV